MPIFISALHANLEAQQLGIDVPPLAPRLGATALAEGANSFQAVSWVAAVALVLTLIPVAYRPRQHQEWHRLEDGDGAVAPVVQHGSPPSCAVGVGTASVPWQNGGAVLTPPGFAAP